MLSSSRLPDGKSVAVTVSIGACLVEPGDSIETVTEMADAALYLAKGEGRNRVMIFDRPDVLADSLVARTS